MRYSRQRWNDGNCCLFANDTCGVNDSACNDTYDYYGSTVNSSSTIVFYSTHNSSDDTSFIDKTNDYYSLHGPFVIE